MITLFNHTHDTLLRGLMKPTELVNKCVELGHESVAITDTALSGVHEFLSASKKKIKPIVGCDFKIRNENHTNILLIAKNLKGWNSLVKSTSRANQDDYHLETETPMLNFDSLSMYNEGLLAITGYLGSEIADIILGNQVVAYYLDETKIKEAANKEWVKDATNKLQEYKEIYQGLFLAIDCTNKPVFKVLNEAMRYLSKKTGIPCVAAHNSFYTTPEQANDQRILLCAKYRCKLSQIDEHLAKDKEVYCHMLTKSNTCGIESSGYTDEEIKNTKLISDMCETYSINRKPLLPHFPCEKNELEYLNDLAMVGWEKKKKKFSTDETYLNRIKTEMEVFKKANLAGYFLIVQDYVNWARNQGWLVGASRGSAGGSLVANLIGIHSLDPLKYDLLFERFYNEGRNTEDNISLPDIDMDFPSEKREEIFNYLKSKYGEEHVGQMCTFGTMKGRGALKEVFGAHDVCTFAEMNTITQFVPDEAAISDQLQEMEDASIIKWALINNRKDLSEWVNLNDDGTCSGKYSKFFEQAIRLEDTKKATSKHAGGVIIGPDKLTNLFPMIRDKSGDGSLIVGVDMGACEASGGVKLDVLGVTILDKVMEVQKLLLEYD